MKTLEQLDQEFRLRHGFPADILLLPKNSVAIPDSPIRKRRRRPVSVIFDVLFYATLVGVLCMGLLYGSRGGRDVFGYSIFNVLTTSMQREIPKGSLVIVKDIGTDKIEIGDDITFLIDKNTTKTHRVIRIFEDYEGSGARGFETKGLENPLADEDIVYAANVVGKVVFHTKGIGDTLAWIKARWIFVLALFIGIFILCGTLKILLFDGGKNKNKKSAETPSRKPSRRRRKPFL
jgi:signal peptidase